MKRIKSKLRKLLVVASCVFLLSCYFMVSASAETTTGQTVIDVLELNSLTIGVFDSSGNVVEVRSIETINGDDEFKPEEGIVFRLTTTKYFSKGELLNVVVSLYSTDNRLNSDGFMVSGSYELGFANDYFNVEKNYSNSTTDLRPYCYRAHRTKDDDGYHYSYYNYGSLSYRDTSYTDYAKSTFTTSEYNGEAYNYYTTKLTVSVLKSGFNEFNIALYNVNFDVLNHDEYLNEKLVADFYNQDFDFPEPEIIDSTTTDNYAKSEEEIFDATSEGRSESVGVFNRFGSLFTSDGHLTRGLLAVTNIFHKFFEVGWLSSIINFGLAIGMFGFVIGTAELLVNAHSRKVRNEKATKFRETQSAYYKSKIDYYKSRKEK